MSDKEPRGELAILSVEKKKRDERTNPTDKENHALLVLELLTNRDLFQQVLDKLGIKEDVSSTNETEPEKTLLDEILDTWDNMPEGTKRLLLVDEGLSKQKILAKLLSDKIKTI